MRTQDWLYSLIPQTLGWVYSYYFFWSEPQLGPQWQDLLLAFWVSLGFAGLGYWINDWFDKESDQIAKKTNMHFPHSMAKSGLTAVLCLLSVALPWYWLPFTSITILISISAITLYVLYSHPTTRLKSHPTWGPIADLAYAYLLPFLLSSYTFYTLLQPQSPHLFLFIFLGLTMLLSGFRNIVGHQLKDVFKDQLSQTTTSIQIWGVQRTDRFLKATLFLEQLAYLILLVICSLEHPVFLGLAIAFLYQSLLDYSKRSNAYPKYTLLFQSALQRPNIYYQVFQPLLILSLLTSKNVDWGLLGLMHGLILIPFYHWLTAKGLLIRWLWIPTKTIASRILNYSIWIVFLSFGVDLKKENCSAWDYLNRNKN
jgi:4-hydroxybenzoate polyprenyltransferase